MATAIKKLYAGIGVATATSPYVVYTVPSGKRVIIKSITVANPTSTDQRFTITLAGYPIVYNHVIKAFDTFVLPAAGFVLNQIETISFGSAPTIHINVTGVVFDTSERVKPYVLIRANTVTTSQTGTVFKDTLNDVLIKSVTFCNLTASDTTIALSIGDYQIIGGKLLKAYDTLTIPFLDQLLVKGETLAAWASSASTVSFYATGMVVT
ncbi:hypothetical protein Q0V21_25020 [Paenibacillus sp. 11B]|uniref:hypothetical protein n=1 Tax=unclassified Paenibacillus TaxID=185978 RepID=UPI0026557860|nr:hypothetical protein [Paenibacillus sp. 11B]MDN8592012.1 hypothetical protein [Paenibacillus sp. 11B]